MRFLIGIVTGAILTLIMATSMDLSDGAAFDRARNAAQSLWDSIIEETSDSLFDSASRTREQHAEALVEALQREKLAGLHGRDEDGPSPATAQAPSPAEEPVEEPVEEPTAEPTPEPTTAPATAPATTQAPLQALAPAAASPAPEEVAPPPPAEQALPPTYQLAMANPDATAVWVAFHSLMSAEGFATRLSQLLEREFRVERRGAGSYEVVFDAASDAERDAVLAEIHQVTGQ